jgi:hypothetical protein
MSTTTKRFAVFGGTGVAATALIVVGLVLPAQATEYAPTPAGSTWSSSSESNSSRSSDRTSNSSFENALDAAILSKLTNTFSGGDVNTDASGTSILNGPLVSGNEIGNGTSILNGNNTPIASGNDVAAPVDVMAPVETDTTTESNDDSSSNTDTDINTGVNNLVDDLLGGSGSGSDTNESFGSSSSGGLNLGSLFGR